MFVKSEKEKLIDQPVAIPMEKFKREEAFAKLVWVRIEFCSFGDVDTVNEKYQAEVKIKSKWYHEEAIDEYDKKKHWYPKLFIENALDSVKEEITYEVTKVEDKSMITEIRVAKGFFVANCLFG